MKKFLTTDPAYARDDPKRFTEPTVATLEEDNMDTPPEIGDVVRVGSGDDPWTVMFVSEASGVVLLSSNDTAVRRSEMPWNLEPFE